jgi:hypothetical protein
LTAVALKRDFDMNTVTESVPTLEPVISPALRANAIRFLAMTGAIRLSLNKDKSEFNPRKLLKDAMQAAKSLCKERFEAFACAGQALRINPIHLDELALRYRAEELAQTVR